MTSSHEEARVFEEWLWSLDQTRLDSFSLLELQRIATQAALVLPQLTFLTVVAESDAPAEVLSSAAGVRESRVGERLALLRVGSGRGRYVVAAAPAADGVVHLFGAPPVTDSRWRRVEETWMRSAAPRMAKVILNRSDFEGIGDALTEHGSIEVARMTARVLRDHSSYSRGWPSEPHIRRLTHREALAETDGMIVRTLTLQVGANTQVHLRREAGASFYRGDFRMFADVVLRRLTTAAAERRELLSDRQRAPRETAAQLLSMKLSDLDLDESSVRAQLVDAVSGIHGMQAAVLHENPYLHVLVSDFLSGASFDVVVTDERRLDIIPGLRSSVGSLARLTDALGSAMGMNELTLAPAVADLSEEELLASF
ncbi:MAG: hypothetical protein GEU88_12880 [Solirubrobacterales bacterium]|nr:hypothetical protein [Solirubrobacterales bacterium]